MPRTRFLTLAVFRSLLGGSVDIDMTISFLTITETDNPFLQVYGAFEKGHLEQKDL
jgi:hypothetical protein